jgi:hypothetical protein
MGGRLRVVIMMWAALLAGAAGSACAETWSIQVVDGGSAGPGSTSLALLQGYPVVAYFSAPRDLEFAAIDRTANRWTLRNVDQGGEFSSIAVDSSGIVHVGYIDASSLELRYWRFNSGQGSIQVIDSESGRGGMYFYNSIQVDPTGSPRISYFHWREPAGTIADRLGYAQLNGASWSKETPDAAVGRGKYQSLALDALGLPEIAYYDSTRALRLTRKLANNTWVSQVIDSAGDPGRFNSLAFDRSGRPHLSYVAATPPGLRYATRSTAGVWRLEDVGGVGSVVNSSVTSLALDSNGNPHIAYYDAAAGALRYASRTTGSWAVQTVDDAGDVGGFCSLRLDSQDRPIISYYDASTHSMKMAYGDYPDGDRDGIPDVFDPCPANPDCNQNGTVDGREGARAPGPVVKRLGDAPIFGCGTVALLYAAGPPRGGPPPADLLFLLGPALYLALRRGRSARPSAPA